MPAKKDSPKKSKESKSNMRGKLKWLFQKNAVGTRGYHHLYNETSGCLRWSFNKSSEGARGCNVVLNKIKTNFNPAKTARRIIMMAIMGSVAGTMLSLKLAERYVRGDMFDDTIQTIKQRHNSTVKEENTEPISLDGFIFDVKSHIAESYENAAITKGAARGAAGMVLLSFLIAGASLTYRTYKESEESKKKSVTSPALKK